VLAQAVVAGDIDAEVLAWLQAAFRQRERQHAALSLDRYLRLPTFKAQRRQRRDYWISETLAHFDAPNASAKHERLHRELGVFMSRGPWLSWLRAGGPPNDVSDDLRRLFEIARNHDRAEVPGVRTIARRARPTLFADEVSVVDAQTSAIPKRTTNHET